MIAALLSHPPSAVRFALVAAGVLLLLLAGRSLVAARPRVVDASSESGELGAGDPPPGYRLLGAVVRCSVRVSRCVECLGRASDQSMLATRLAAAPRCWPSRMVAAGARHGPRVAGLTDVMPGVRLTTSLLCAAAAGSTYVLVGPVGAAVAVACGAALGAALPDVVLVRAARRARSSGGRDSAAAVDVLAAAVGSGMGLREALELTAGHASPVVAAALRAAAVRTSTGGEPRAALTVEGTRFGVPVLADVGAAVDRQRRLGAALGPELQTIAARLRSEERARILETAARRGPLGTLVVALVIAPVCLAALTACLVGGLVEGGGLGLR